MDRKKEKGRCWMSLLNAISNNDFSFNITAKFPLSFVFPTNSLLCSGAWQFNEKPLILPLLDDW